MRTWVLLLLTVTLLTAPQRAAAQRSDNALAEDVAEAVLSYSRFSIFDDVSVNVNNRAVVLTGRVTTPLKRDEIGKRVAKIDGIRTLTNSIGVLPNSPMDSRMRMQVASAIYNHPSFWQYAQMANPPIHIIVENGQITLTGAVSSEVDKALAFSLAQIGGSFGVTNRLMISRR